jgi:hypothetical protein
MRGAAGQGPVFTAQSQICSTRSPISPSNRIDDVHFNGGFGRAAPLTIAEILSPREGETALVAAEEGILAEVNALGQAKLARLAGHKASPRAPGPGGWRAIGLDAEGLDLAAGGRAARAQFAAPAHDPEAWRARLEHLLAGGQGPGAPIRSRRQRPN